MLVTVSSECFSHLPLDSAFQKLIDLEFSTVEIAIHEHQNHLRPSQVHENLTEAIVTCQNTRRLDVVAYSFDSPVDFPLYLEQFESVCRLARATKVATLIVRSSELGTPFNEEVERLKQLVQIGSKDGVRVSVHNEVGRMSEDPDTLMVLCNNIEELGVCLDPSHYICHPKGPQNYEKLIPYVHHVRLRDTTKKELQVKIGKGIVDYGHLVTLLRQENYQGALSIHQIPLPNTDHMAEMRKLRLLIESLML
ncbi:MAG: sugar phosphate isomerase/epimerase [Pirellulaceae bacterium]|nr:sugar phosphate isomerase/epimerase [Pirellulaceae bacterium]